MKLCSVQIFMTISLAVFKVYSYAGHARNATNDGKIVGGHPVSIEQYPHQVSLENSGNFYCGGCLIDPRTVITAGHCIFDLINVKGIRVRAGSNTREMGGQAIYAASATVHPRYDHNPTDYDVAIIKLKAPFNLGPAIKPITLAGREPQEGTRCTVSGYGSIGSGGSLSTQLQAVDVSIVSRDNCRQVYSESEITDRMICAGVYQGGKDACQGDSGGPIISSKKLVGVVSWGRGCGEPRTPGVYTNLAHPEILSFVRGFIQNG